MLFVLFIVALVVCISCERNRDRHMRLGDYNTDQTSSKVMGVIVTVLFLLLVITGLLSALAPASKDSHREPGSAPAASKPTSAPSPPKTELP